MKNFYLIGESTKKSFSPIIHDWVYKFLNIEAVYSTKDIRSSDFNDSIKNILFKSSLKTLLKFWRLMMK